MSLPATGCQELTEGDEGHSLCSFYDKRVATEVAADAPGEEQRGMWFASGVGTKCPRDAGSPEPWPRVRAPE